MCGNDNKDVDKKIKEILFSDDSRMQSVEMSSVRLDLPCSSVGK